MNCGGQPLSLSVSQAPHCQGRPIAVTILDSGNIGNIDWSIVPQRNAESGPRTQKTFSVNFTAPGTYTVRTQATGSVIRSGSVVLNISRSASADFNAHLTAPGFPTELDLTNYSSGALFTVWRFSDGTTDSSVNVIKAYATSGSHSVQLVAHGPNGCNDTATYRFHIADSSGITLPNIFTPNGDGVNDVYRPIAGGIKTLQARIFNREQMLVHAWDRVNGFWDGRTTSGEPCTEGVYVIAVEATGFDGKKYSVRGTITLMR